jgi:GT2 family glycosyltransferase
MISASSPDNNHTMPWVGIIILNWRGLSDTLSCLSSLKKITYANVKTIVVENGSGDLSAATIREEFPEVFLLVQEQNHGFVGGNNVGIEFAQQAGLDYVLLLNNDVEVESSFLTRMVAEMEGDLNAGVAGPTICYYDHPDVIWSAGGRVDWVKGETHMIGIGEKDQGQFGISAREVEWITGCALLIRMAVIEQIGGLDDRFFAYYEDSEYCLRAHRLGWNVLHIPSAMVWHKISAVAREESPQVNYYMTRNRLLFLRLTHARVAAWLYTFCIHYGVRYVNWLLNPRWRGKKEQRKALLRAVTDFLRGRFGKVEINA